MYQESSFLGHFLVLCTAGSLELPGASPPGPPTRALPWTHWGPYSPPIPPAAPGNDIYGHCISCLRQDTTFIRALTTNLAHHSEILKKRPAICLSLSVTIWPCRRVIQVRKYSIQICDQLWLPFWNEFL